MKLKNRVTLLLAVAVFCFAGPALAHRVNVFAWVEGNTIHTQSKFGGGRKAMDAPIEVYDDQGKKLLEGRTDANGEFSFVIPKRSALKIVLKAGMGHQNQWVVPLDEILAGGAPLEKSSEAALPWVAMTAQPGSPKEDMAGQQKPTAPQISEALVKRMELAVEKAVEKKIQPLTRMLAESRPDRPSLTDILGGLGYILGLVGIGAYVHSRKKGATNH